MLTARPWNRFNLRIICFSNEAKDWWDEARLAKGLVRTDAARRKWVKDGKVTEERGWEDRDVILDRIEVMVRPEGVDGTRLMRKMNEDGEGEKIMVNDGKSFHPSQLGINSF